MLFNPMNDFVERKRRLESRESSHSLSRKWRLKEVGLKLMDKHNIVFYYGFKFCNSTAELCHRVLRENVDHFGQCLIVTADPDITPAVFVAKQCSE